MRNLFQFIWKYQFTFIFLLLEVVGFTLLINNNGYHRSSMSSFATAVAGRVYSLKHLYSQYIGLREENTRLANENLRLRSALQNQLGAQKTNTGGYHSMGDFEVITAEAIASTSNLTNNYLIINRGTESGVVEGAGVLSPDGILGVVHSVSENYAAVLPLIHSKSIVSARLANSNYFGLCIWDGKSPEYALLQDIPNHVNVHHGDTVITRGASGIFPSDQIIGYVVETTRDESSGFQEIRLKLASDFSKVKNVYVVVNKNQSELDSLTTSFRQWTEN
ncbi:MAG: hypothetical protein Kow0075_17080 [Salibacteraceae bacterium]